MRLLTFITLLLCLTFTPHAQVALNSALDVEADALDVHPTNGSAKFSGNVKLVHDGMTLTCNTLTLNSAKDNKKLDTATANGNVTLSFNGGTATGATAVWQTQTGDVVMSGSVKLSQNGSSLMGEKLTYNLNTKQARLTSGNTGRVKAVFMPSK